MAIVRADWRTMTPGSRRERGANGVDVPEELAEEAFGTGCAFRNGNFSSKHGSAARPLSIKSPGRRARDLDATAMVHIPAVVSLWSPFGMSANTSLRSWHTPRSEPCVAG